VNATKYLDIPDISGSFTSAYLNLSASNTEYFQNGLYSYVPFDEASGFVAKNYINTSLNGTLETADFITGGVNNRTVYMSGTGNNHTIFPAKIVPYSTEWTIAFWMYPVTTDVGVSNYYVTNENTDGLGGHTFNLFSLGSGAMRFSFENDVAPLDIAVVSTGAWHFITLVYNNTNFMIWVDGVNKGNGTINPVLNEFNSVNQLWFGGIADDNEEGDIRIDEFGVWTKAMSDYQIRLLYNTTWTLTNHSNITNPVLYLGDINVWNYSGVFVQTDVKTGNLNTELNDYLSSCSYVSNTCSVPFRFYSEKTGFLNYSGLDFGSFTSINSATNWFNNETFELSSESIKVEVDYNSSSYSSINAILNYNNTEYTPSLVTSGDIANFTATIVAPSVSADTTIQFYWNVTLSNATDSESTVFSNQTQRVKNLEIDNCAVNTFLIYNLTMRDESLKTILNGSLENTTIEIDLTFSSLVGSNEATTFSRKYNMTNPALVCLNADLGTTQYRADYVIGYVADSYVNEFYIWDNATISNTTFPQTINLYDLDLTESTSFLFKFLDVGGLLVPDAIVSVLRYYIGDGEYIEVERAKQDDSGETIIHLVEEDVLYKFQISLYNRTLFTSNSYTAKCLSSPCQLVLSAQPDIEDFPTFPELDNVPEGYYEIDTNKTTRDVVLLFNFNQTYLMNLTVIEYSNTDSTSSVVGSGELTASQGVITVNVPISYGNETYRAVVYRDGEFLNSIIVDLKTDNSFYFGILGYFLAGMLFLMICAMGLSSGDGIFIFAIVGFVLSGSMLLFNHNYLSIIGFIAIVSLILVRIAPRRRIE